MDTGDPIAQDDKKKGGKGNKKKKEKKISLDVFLKAETGAAVIAPVKSNNWALLTENAEDECENNYKFDRSTLPTAPKAAMGPAVDLSLIPNEGPFSAYIGNLSYDANEEDLQRLFAKLEIDTVRIITDGGRPRGYAYVDFLTKESLIEALSYNDRDYMSRSIKVDLATDKNQDGRGGYGRGSTRSNEPDRTEGDWRRKDPSEIKPPSNSFGSRDDRDSRSGRFGDRDRDRGYGFGDRDRGSGFGDRDRGSGFGDRDRGFGDRDRGSGFGDRDRDRGSGFGDRDRGSGFGDRDRGFGDRDRDRGFGDRDRDRGFGGDRDRGFGDRDRGFGDRDRGYGSGRDRDFGDRGGRYGSRDGFGRRDDNDRRPGSRDGSRERWGGHDRDKDRDFGDRGGRYNSRGGDYGRRDDYSRRDRQDDGYDRRPKSRDGSQEHRSEPSKERPVLKLQPRSKPVENKENQPTDGAQRASSIFGSAKPVDTYAKEREIEQKLKSKEIERDDPRARYDDTSNPRRHGDDGPVSRRDSQSSRTSDDNTPSENPRSPTSPTSPKSVDLQQAKMVPAPPPSENAWGKKRDSATSATPPVLGGGRDSSNNAAPPKRDDRPKHPGAGRGNPGAGRGTHQTRSGEAHRDRDRRPGNRANGDGHDQPAKSRPVRERHLPKSVDEMPKYEENRAKDFSGVNKFSYLMEDGGNDDSGSDDCSKEQPATTAAASS